jgi:glutaredoxin
VLLIGVAAQPVYIRVFPRLSQALGYGSVSDVAASRLPDAPGVTRVVLYTARACPFCPILKRRLVDLQPRLGFDLKVVDVTFRPNLVRAKGLRSVPVVEAGGRFLVGNATSAQLVSFLADAGTPQHTSV